MTRAVSPSLRSQQVTFPLCLTAGHAPAVVQPNGQVCVHQVTSRIAEILSSIERSLTETNTSDPSEHAACIQPPSSEKS
eukprot:4650154-Ditylum_brightwellii.AAC.1